VALVAGSATVATVPTVAIAARAVATKSPQMPE
jgi:hypothetical protein